MKQDNEQTSKADRLISFAIYGFWALLLIFWAYSAISPGILKSMTAVDREHESGQLVNRAISLSMSGNQLEAVELLNRALAIKPGMPEALINLGVISKINGDYNSACEYLDRALREKGSDSSSIYANLSDIDRARGDSAGAESFIRLSLGTCHCPIDRLMKEGIYEMGRQNFGRSIDLFKSCIEQRLRPEVYYENMLFARLHSDDTSKTRRAGIESMLRHGATSRELRHYSILLFRYMIYKDRSLAETYNKLGYIYARTGMPREAKECFQEALKIWKDYPDAISNLEYVGRMTERR